MTDEISYVKLKLLTKWLNDLANEIEENKTLSNEELVSLLMSMKNIMTDINTEIEIIMRELTQNKKA